MPSNVRASVNPGQTLWLLNYSFLYQATLSQLSRFQYRSLILMASSSLDARLTAQLHV